MPPNPAEVAAGRLAREMTSWKAIEVHVRDETTNHILRPHHAPRSENVETYIETSRGQRLADVMMSIPGRASAHVAGYCDGSRCAKVTFSGTKQSDIAVSRSFMNEAVIGSTNRPSPLVYFYAGKVPLYEALAKAKYLGPGKAADRPSEVFLVRRVKWSMAVQDLVYDLDKETSIPLRVRSYAKDFDEANPDGSAPVWVWTARAVDTVQGYHLPLRSEFVQYDLKTGAKRSSREITVESVRYNGSYPRSTFWPAFQPGVNVSDAITKKAYMTPAPKAPAAVETKLATAVSPYRAVPPSDWSAWAPQASLGFGFVLLATGLVMRRWRS